jgi:hypothetical protein
MYRFNGVLVAVLMALLLANSNVQARVIENLYSATVDVGSQDSRLRQQALIDAFRQVIIKVTGQPELIDDTAIKSASRNVNEFLVQYGYRREGSQTQLTATFDGQKLRELLATNAMPYWGSRRPELLLWLATDTGGKRQLIGSSDESVFTQQLRSKAKQLAIPIQLPILDLTDSMQVSVTDVWGRFIGPIKTASTRYATDGFVVVRVTENPQAEDSDKRYQLDWRVEVDSKRLQGIVYASSTDWLAGPFIAELAKTLAAEYSVVNSDQQSLVQVPLSISGLEHWQQVLMVESFLQTIPSVDAIKLERYATDQSDFVVTVRGSEDNLLQSIQLDGRLRSQEISPFVNPKLRQQTIYQWVGD